MAATDPGFDQGKLGLELQARYDFYVVALAFTLLGLSVQTAQFGGLRLANFLELVGWVALFVSGLAGMGRLALMPWIHQRMGAQTQMERTLGQLREARARGASSVVGSSSGPTDVGAAMAQYERDLQELDRLVRGKVDSAQRWYKVRAWTFALGVVAIMAARALAPATDLVCAVQARLAFCPVPVPAH